jgi:RNA polymerase sigma-70 factor (ECF subfamily)
MNAHATLTPSALDALPLEDMQLVQRIAAGDRAAFELLMRRYNRRLYRLARATLRDDAEAEDALQEAYLSAYRAMGQFRGESAVSTWLSRLVINECLGRLRKSARRQNVVPMVPAEEVDVMPAAANDNNSPEKLLVRTQMRSLIERKLDELPEDFRTVFVLRAVEEMSVEETAACLGIPEPTVRSRHFRARSLLRESLAQEIDVAERSLFEFGGRHCDRVVAAVMDRLDALP